MKNLLLGIIAINLTIISINMTLRSVEPAHAEDQLSRNEVENIIEDCEVWMWSETYGDIDC